MRLANSVAMSTVEASRDCPRICPRPPLPAAPMAGAEVSTVGCRLLFPTESMLAGFSIENPASMLSVGNNKLQPTVDTSAPAIGAAGSGGRGQILGQSLEASTVDIATEFANLMAFQQSYQANSRVITTADQMTQDLIGLIR